MRKRPASNPRGRGPSVEKTTLTRQAIVAAAIDIFLARGFSQTRMADIAVRAKVSKGLLYKYFADKETMFESAIRELALEPLQRFEDFYPEAHESCRNFLLRTGPRLIRNFSTSKRAAMIRLVLAEGARFPRIGEAYRRVALEPLWEAIARVVRLAEERGELRGDALVRFPRLLTAPALFGAISEHILQDRKAPASDKMFVAMVEAMFAEGDGNMRRPSVRLTG